MKLSLQKGTYTVIYKHWLVVLFGDGVKLFIIVCRDFAKLVEFLLSFVELLLSL